MELQGTWTRDEEGFMEFETPQMQRLYEAVTDKYHEVYNQYLHECDDEEEACDKALEAGYEMLTDYKLIDGKNEFVTSYKTPVYLVDMWYEADAYTGKKNYSKGFIRISGSA